MGKAIYARDKQMLEKAGKITEKGQQISKPESFRNLAYFFQHSDNIADYQLALTLATKAVALGLNPKESLIPKITDRIIVQKQQDRGIPLNQITQKFGTQTLLDQTGEGIKPLLDGTANTEELVIYGLE